MSGDVPPGWYPDPNGGLGARRWDGSRWESVPEEFPGPAPEPAPDLKPSKGRRWVALAGLGVAVIAAAVGATLLTLHLSGEKPVSAPVTVTSVAPLPVPPTPSFAPVEVVQADVKASMQNKLNTDSDLKQLGLRVVDVTLAHKGGNEYKGIAHVRTKDGVVHDVPVEVTSDAQNTLWEAPPGWLDFALPFYQPSATPSMGPVPGADETGFIGGPRCMEGNRANLLILTAKSEVAICRKDGPNEVYTYSGKRLSDGGKIILPAVPLENGWEAVNPADGTRYTVGPDGLAITTPEGETFSETAIAVGP